MIDENLSIDQILDWYCLAGVDATLDDLPFALSQKSIKSDLAVPAQDNVTRVKNVNAVGGSDGANLRKSYQHSDNLNTALKDESQKLQNSAPRPAMTDLAQDTLNACANASHSAAQASSLSELKEVLENFDGCALKLTASHTVFGEGNPQAKIMLIGEAPGADEDRMGIPFVGKSGKLLDEILNAAGFNRNEDCFIANVLPWRPPGNRTPTTAEVAVCLPFLKRQIELVNPKALVLLGGSSANALFDNQEPISKLRGKWWEYHLDNGTVIQSIATFHPAYLLRNPAQKAKIWADFLRLKKFLANLSNAL